MSQEKLAIEVCCNRRTVSNIEMGKNIPSIALAYKIALALNHPVTDIFPPESCIAFYDKDNENKKEQS